MYIYISQEVLNNADAQLQTAIERLQRKIEQDASLFPMIFDCLFPYWRTKLRRTWRLIATVQIISGEEILCLTHLLQRSSHDYDTEFLHNREAWGAQKVQINQHQLTEWLRERQLQEELENAPQPQPNVPENLMPWLNTPSLQQNGHRGCDIFESRLWVDKWTQRDESQITSNWLSFHRIILQILEPQQNSDLQSNETTFANVNRCIDLSTECTVLYSVVSSSDYPHRRIIVLLDLFPSIPSFSDIAQVGKSLRVFGQSVPCNIFESSITTDRLTRIARRAYPDYILWDEQIWHSLEIDSDVNLALSGEEETLLRNVRLPIFINGRAGSGKSTMLHYMFAYYCDLYLRENRDNIDQPTQIFPLFLTYNQRLVDRARKVVKSVLTSHAHYIEQSYNTEDLEPLENCFQSFQDFLLSKLPFENSFLRSNHISFNEFKERFDRSFPNERYSAEIVWHTIRTYIKGFDFSEDNTEFLTFADYKDEISNKHKSVSDQDFQQIIRFWRWYQDLQNEENLWDDQDLVRFILQSIINGELQISSYAAIFCDEAQDFTRIELQLILRLSAWSQYRLRPPVHSLPFAFAGDPMQTVNPTGFRWNNLRANFYERILLPLDPDGSKGICNPENVMLRELQQNYRSTREIVYFSNIVHLWRKVLLNLTDINPQNSWWDDQQSARVGKGVISQNFTVQELAKLANQGIIFVLPCDEGGEMAFIRDTPQLLQAFPSINEQILPPNVYSAVAVKGSEFPVVIALFFGEYFAEAFGERDLEITPQNIELEYFLNKLYVAISRGQEYLAVIDTQRGDQRLWQFANQQQVSNWIGRLPNQNEHEHWRSQTSFLDDHVTPNMSRGANSLDLAKIFLQDGLNYNKSQFFNSAASYFQRADRPLDEEYCQTWLVRLQGNLREAGQRFMKLQDRLENAGSRLVERSLDPVQDAWECFWGGQHWQEILAWCDRCPERLENRWRFVAAFMVQTSDQAEVKNLADITYSFTDALVTIVDQWQADTSDLREVNWRSVLIRYHQIVNQLLDSSDNLNIESIYLQTWSQISLKLVTIGFDVQSNLFLAARCAYQSENYQEAVSLWERCPDDSIYRNRQDYALAKSEITPVPEKFDWLNRAGKSEQIVNLWKGQKEQFDRTWQPYTSIIRQALEKHGESKELLDLDIKLGRWVAAILYFNNRVKDQDPSFDDSARFEVLKKMSEDRRLTSQSIEEESSKIFEQGIRITENVQNERDSVRQGRRLLTQFINETTRTKTWTKDLASIETVTQAFRNVGEFVPELQFHEQFKGDLDMEICEYAKREWIEIKRKQANFSRQDGKIADAERYGREADNAEKTWQCEVNSPPEDPTEEIRKSLGTLTQSELESVKHYIRFLKFEKSL